MWVLWVILGLLLVYAVLLLLKKATPLGRTGRRTAEQILKGRLARGEIGRTEYERRRRRLRG